MNYPAISRTLANTYRLPANLLIGGEVLLSMEGTTQRIFYRCPCILYLPGLFSKSTNKGCKQVWYADDASAGGPLKPLRQWWNKLTDFGSIFGYIPNATKSWLIVRLGFLDGFLDTAKHLYYNANVNITTEGRKYLGAALGNKKIGKTIPQTKSYRMEFRD